MRRRFTIPLGLAGLTGLSCQMGEEDDEIGYGCVFVDKGSSCPTERPSWVDIHSDEAWLFGGYGYYGYYGYSEGEDDDGERPAEDGPPECGTSVGQDWQRTGWSETCRPTGIEYIGRARPEAAALGCPIPADQDLCCYEFSCEREDWY